MAGGHSRAQYCFGLHWFALVDGPSGAGLRRLLQSHRHAGYCLAGAGLLAVGLWDVLSPKEGVFMLSSPESGKAGQDAVAYSAAACLASQHPEGCILALWVLSDGRYWLVAAHDGAVIGGTDCVFDVLEHARAMQSNIQQRYPSLLVLPQPDDLASHLAQGRQDTCRLLPTDGRGGRTAVWLPALLLLLAGSWVAVVSVAESDPPLPQADPQLVLLDVQQQHALSGGDGLRALLSLLEGIPYRAARWQLHQVECHTGPREWSCSAHYEPADAQATNQGFQALLGPQTDVHFPALDQARLMRTAAFPQQGLDVSVLQGRQHNERELFSRLQAVRPAFGHLALGQSLPPEGLAPLLERLPETDSNAWSGLRRRAWRSQSPLRSAYLLLPVAHTLKLEKASLQIDPQAIASLAGSVLTLNLEGYLYEQDDSLSVPPAPMPTTDLFAPDAVDVDQQIRSSIADHGS